MIYPDDLRAAARMLGIRSLGIVYFIECFKAAAADIGAEHAHEQPRRIDNRPMKSTASGYYYRPAMSTDTDCHRQAFEPRYADLLEIGEVDGVVDMPKCIHITPANLELDLPEQCAGSAHNRRPFALGRQRASVVRGLAVGQLEATYKR